jgi:hypothetical protein
VKVFVEQKAIAPCPVALEAGIRSQRWPTAIGVAQEQSEQAALEFVCHLFEVCLHA